MKKTIFARLRYAIRNLIKLMRYLAWFLPYSRIHWIADAKKKINQREDLSETEKENLFIAYCRDYDKYQVKYSEYIGYGFPSLSDSEKKTIISMRELLSVLKKFDIKYPNQRKITDNKDIFLETYKKYVHRKWILVNDYASETELQELLDSSDVIVKPTDSCSGNGVYKIKQGTGSASVIMAERPVMVEECVYNESSLAAFHPESLNTVRITTISNGKECRVLGAAFRTGNNGSVFDNADAGGYFASINIDTGRINSDGINEMGESVKSHPATGCTFYGFQIPRWQDTLSTCVNAAMQLDDSYVIAWDVAIKPDNIELIEGNSRPSIELHQTPLHRGIRREFYTILRELKMTYWDALWIYKLFSWKPIILLLEKRYIKNHQ